jgi:hypothetical protein
MNDKTKYLALYICSAIILVLLVTGGIATQKPKEVAPASTLNLNPSAETSPTGTESTEAESIPYSWEDYAHDEYNFSLIYPEKWYKQEYPSKESKGGTFVAFSPEPLPCEDCTYLQDAYFSIKIYNQKTDPEAYAAFLQRGKAIGKVEGYLPARLGNKQGVLFGSIISAENEGWVYEIALEKNEGKTPILDSHILKRVISSFKFTNLVFTN